VKILITGICGFVGSSVARELKARVAGIEIFGLDNLSRPGSELNRRALSKFATRIFHADIRNPSDLESLPAVDWVIDAAANPSVLAGLGKETSSRQVMEHNLVGTLHLLEYCKRQKCGLVMLSTSRVYSLEKLAALPMENPGPAFVPCWSKIRESGFSAAGVAENFSTQPPLSLYGAAKLASELVILEYASAFQFPVHINRCGVLAGAGQFGKPDQGIFSFWIHSHRQRQALKYIGFGGTGFQVRDCLHPRDLAGLVARQINQPRKAGVPLNVSGGIASATSLTELTKWCDLRFGPHPVASSAETRPFDVPWLALDSSAAEKSWDWRPQITRDQIFEEIARHAEANPGWLELSRDS
jgi:CDP-paratose 2-epimerase